MAKTIGMQSEVPRSASFQKALSDPEMFAFCSLLTVRVCQPKDQIIVGGQQMSEFYIVCKGSVHVRRMADQAEMLPGRIGGRRLLLRGQYLLTGHSHRQHLGGYRYPSVVNQR